MSVEDRAFAHGIPAALSLLLLLALLPQLTRTDIARDEWGDPFHAVVTATEPALYECPFLFASDVGTIGFSDAEAEQLRDYLLKGGFLWADDFWGNYAWRNWTAEMQRVLPGHSIVPATDCYGRRH